MLSDTLQMLATEDKKQTIRCLWQKQLVNPPLYSWRPEDQVVERQPGSSSGQLTSRLSDFFTSSVTERFLRPSSSFDNRVTLPALGLSIKGNRGFENFFKILIHGALPCIWQALHKSQRNRICQIAVVRAGSNSLLKACCAGSASVIRLMRPTPLTFITWWVYPMPYGSRERWLPPGTKMRTSFSLVQKLRCGYLHPCVNLSLQYFGAKLSLPI